MKVCIYHNQKMQVYLIYYISIPVRRPIQLRQFSGGTGGARELIFVQSQLRLHAHDKFYQNLITLSARKWIELFGHEACIWSRLL